MATAQWMMSPVVIFFVISGTQIFTAKSNPLPQLPTEDEKAVEPKTPQEETSVVVDNIGEMIIVEPNATVLIDVGGLDPKDYPEKNDQTTEEDKYSTYEGTEPSPINSSTKRSQRSVEPESIDKSEEDASEKVESTSSQDSEQTDDSESTNMQKRDQSTPLTDELEQDEQSAQDKLSVSDLTIKSEDGSEQADKSESEEGSESTESSTEYGK